MRLACGAVIEVPGSAFYTQLGVDGLLLAGGAYRWSADQLARYRWRWMTRARAASAGHRGRDAVRRGHDWLAKHVGAAEPPH
jgi:hypothetical protein